ncbi:MAG TPA: hypothetical protein VLA77_01755 [Candidatus Saccharimonadales bacterium]|nr:hypothetical protein [Candidatus Saccharimonadales bacterium]
MRELLNKKISRKQFLQYAGFAFLTVTGISGMLNNLGNIEKRIAGRPSSNNFGSGAYGG